MQLDVLSITAHPDDTELTCSGTVIKMVEAGYKVGLLDLTGGESGTRGNARLRERIHRRVRCRLIWIPEISPPANKITNLSASKPGPVETYHSHIRIIRRRGAACFSGTAPDRPERASRLRPLHSDRFMLDEEAMIDGVALLAGLAANALGAT